MFESQKLVPAHLLFEFVANKMQLFFDLLHIPFQDRDVFFQFTDRFEGCIALLTDFVQVGPDGIEALAKYLELSAEIFQDDGILVPAFL